MAVLTQIPSVNTQTDIVNLRDTLNANGAVVGSFLPAYFTASANINMWSRRKPVIYKKTGTITDAEMATAGDKSVPMTTPRYGINIVGGAGVNLADIYMYAGPLTTGGAWYYLPKGGEDEPLRLSDFNGYYPAATQPLRGSFSGVVTVEPLTVSTSSYAIEYTMSNQNHAGELGFSDLYDSTDPDGNAITWRTGLILVDKSNASNKYFVLDNITAAFTQTHKGKTFYAVQFITSYPDLIVPTSLSDQKWARYTQYAIPDGSFELSIRNTSSGGNVGVQTSIRISVNTGFPKFFGLDTDPYSDVSMKFQLTVVGGTGQVKSLGVGIYPNSNCNKSDELGYKSIISSTTNITGTKSYTATIRNTSGSTNLYTCIWLDGNKQQINKVAMPVIERPTVTTFNI